MSLLKEAFSGADKLVEEYGLTEAANLTADEKIEAWHDGKRNENLKACLPSKLKLYFNLCKKKGYKDLCRKITEEMINRDNFYF